MKKNKACQTSGAVAMGHILFVVGIYVLTWGFIGSAGLGAVLKSPIFWGLFVIGLGMCAMASAHKNITKK